MGFKAGTHHSQVHNNSLNVGFCAKSKQQLKTHLTALSRKKRQLAKAGAAFVLVATVYYYLWIFPKGHQETSEHFREELRRLSRPTLTAQRCAYPPYVLRSRDVSQLLYDEEEDTEEDPTWRARVGPTPRRQHNYTVIYNFLSPPEGDKPVADAVTLVTHCTPDLILPHVVNLLEAWPPPHPLSIAVYSPGRDFCLAWALLSWLWRCGDPDGVLGLRDRVRFHVFFPELASAAVSAETAARESGGIGLLEVDCLQRPPDNIKSFDSPYPSNAAVNIARLAVATDFALSQEIDLVPSHGLAQNFLKLNKEIFLRRISVSAPTLFAVLAFEVAADVGIPTSKTDLAELLVSEKARILHGDSLPFSLDSWINAPASEGVSVTLQPSSVKWLPFFIGNNSEPLLEERFYQEGGKEKYLLYQELCLSGYQFLVLDGAFLAKKKRSSKKSLLDKVAENNLKLRAELESKLNNSACSL